MVTLNRSTRFFAPESEYRAASRAIDLVFGSYCVLLMIIAIIAWMRGEGTINNIILFAAFTLINGLISAFATIFKRPFGVEIGRTIIGACIAPLAYLFADAPFHHWWPGFMIMCLGGCIALGLMTGKALWGRLLVLYYLSIFLLTEFFGTPAMEWYQFFVHAGAICTVALLFIEIMVILGRLIIREREQIELNRELQQRIEQSIIEQSQLAAIIENTSDYVGIADLEGNSRYINKAGRQMIGLSDEEYEKPRNVANCYPDSELPKVFEMITTALHGEVWAGEIELLHKDGHIIPVSEVTFALPERQGDLKHLATIMRDISEHKQIQSELRQAKELAEAASRAKSTFLANMSHEIRTPMNAVIGMTGLLLHTQLDPRQHDFVETIRTAGDALLGVINDILDFSKIEAGKLDLEQQPFDLRLCVESAIDLLAPRAAEKGLDLVFTVDPELPSGVVGDMARLRQILVNLLSNAIKFTERGEVVLSVMHDNRPNRLHISVRDTGIGISREQIGRLFQSFSQLDPSTTRVFGGTGLGLAISRRLAELMGGQMWAESGGSGTGASFHFTIAAPAGQVPIRPYLYQRSPALVGRRVLVVDDTPTNRRILQLQLQTWGIISIEAASPSAALALLHEHNTFDLAILDMDLPEMDGIALAAAIQAQPAYQNLPLCMLTSFGQSHAAPAMERFVACLTKPVKPSQLYDMLVGIFANQLEQRTAAPVEPTNQIDRLATQLPLRILVAEDVAVNQKFALLALEDLGYRADIAANGLEAIAAATRQPYDVILMDVQMPEVDGMEATRRIRSQWTLPFHQRPAWQRPYIVAVTANALQGDRELCLAAGMDDYMSKPIYLEELQSALERAAQQQQRLAVQPESIQKLLARPRGQQVVTLYIEESTSLVAQLQQAMIMHDLAALRLSAHSLKGSSRYIGAESLAALCLQLEQQSQAAQLNMADLDPFVAAIAELHNTTLAQIAILTTT